MAEDGAQIDAALGVVAIGRNEGDRLVRCLQSARARAGALVYVDSGSTDGSVKRARDLGAHVVELDPSRPFTAARARNAGLQRLEEVCPALERVQFVDGDCELAEGWLELAAARLAERPELAVVCGRRRERHPQASPYNRLTDIEWDTPIGEARACGGDALMRVRVLREVGGFNAGLIAGEEPELCHRIRRAGHGIERLDAEMTRHDAALTRFGEWWRRQVRSGHAYAELVALHGPGAEPTWTRSLMSQLAWGLALPAAIVAAAIATQGLGLLGGLAYPVLVVRIVRGSSIPGSDAVLYGLACGIGKFAQTRGALEFAWNRYVVGRASTLIEYKGPAGPGAGPGSGA